MIWKKFFVESKQNVTYEFWATPPFNFSVKKSESTENYFRWGDERFNVDHTNKKINISMFYSGELLIAVARC